MLIEFPCLFIKLWKEIFNIKFDESFLIYLFVKYLNINLRCLSNLFDFTFPLDNFSSKIYWTIKYLYVFIQQLGNVSAPAFSKRTATGVDSMP